jgi:competence/damage-inducible protein CinA-like protein
VRAEVLAVGTELLLGDIANTNAQHIATSLARAGVDCLRHVCVGDNEERIARAIEEGLERADAVIVTGGLGPTQDDVTREAIARVTGRALITDEAVVRALETRFAQFGRTMPPSNLRQAQRPEGSVAIDAVGTAPGLIVEHGGRVIYALPGVPWEMKDMLASTVIPDLQRRSGRGASIVSRVLRIGGMAESGVADALSSLWDRLGQGHLTMAFLAGGGEIRVRLTAKSSTADEASSFLDEAEREVRSTLGDAVVGRDEQTLEVVVGELLSERGWTLGAAESLTGGLLGARITSVPGSSEYFRGSLVAYTTDVKHNVLGVASSTLEKSGAVSEAAAREMAAGTRRVLEADVGVATTGVAGPAEHGAPVGSVFIAVDGPAGADARGLKLPGDRSTVRELTVSAALNLVRLYLLE